MKTTLILLLLLLIYSFSIQAQDSIVYSNVSKITWENFKGVPKTSDSARAQISTTIQMKINKVNIWTGISTFSAWGIMYPTLSWVKNEYKNDYALNHEQLHFDISELVAKRLEIYINKEKINGGAKTKATKIFNEYLKMLYELQAKYDLETTSPINEKTQSKWNEQIRGELEELEKQSLITSKMHENAF